MEEPVKPFHLVEDESSQLSNERSIIEHVARNVSVPRASRDREAWGSSSREVYDQIRRQWTAGYGGLSEF